MPKKDSEILKTHLIQQWNEGVTQVSLEMGHIYAYPEYLGRQVNQVVTDEEKIGIELGLELYAWLANCGVSVHSILFVDDLHGNDDHSPGVSPELDERVGQAMETYQKMGFTPDSITYETELLPAAAHAYGLLVMRGVLSGGSRFLPKPYLQTPLFHEKNQGTREPSCSLLDAAFYKKKLGWAGDRSTVTILPDSYQAQQHQVRSLMAALGDICPAICVAYFSPLGGVTAESWGKKGDGYVK